MNSNEWKFNAPKLLWATLPLVALVLLNGCGEHLVAPSAVTGSATNALSRPSVTAAKTMSLEIARSFPDAKYVKIFDNLAHFPAGKYWGEVEIVIVGGGANKTFPDDQVAAAFTPSGNHTATVIEVAVTSSVFEYGSSGFSLSLNQDAKGVPGKVLLSAQLPGLPNNGLGFCCALVIGKIPNGIALRGGKQYWIVLDGQSAPSSDAAAWDMNDTDQVHPFLDAEYCAYAARCPSGVVGWYPFQGTLYGTGAAFAVLGSN